MSPKAVMHTDRENQLCLLLVDDEPQVCTALARLFRKRGFSIQTAHDGAEALRIIGSGKVHIMITDMRMPGMSGAQLLAEVAEHHPHIFRIMLSGFADLRETSNAFRSGLVDHFLPKPWENDQLERCVLEASSARAKST